MEGLGLYLPLLLKAVNNILVAPANLVRQTLKHTLLSTEMRYGSLQSNRP